MTTDYYKIYRYIYKKILQTSGVYQCINFIDLFELDRHICVNFYVCTTSI